MNIKKITIILFLSIIFVNVQAMQSRQKGFGRSTTIMRTIHENRVLSPSPERLVIHIPLALYPVHTGASAASCSTSSCTSAPSRSTKTDDDEWDLLFSAILKQERLVRKAEEQKTQKK